MGGLPIGMIEDLVAERRAELARMQGRPAPARAAKRGRSVPRHRAPARAAGRILVAAGLRLAGPDALRGVRIAGAAVPGGRAPI